MYLADVIVEHPVATLDRSFLYYTDIPIKKGVRVKVRFNRQHLVGYVLKVRESDAPLAVLNERYGFKIARIEKIIDEEPILNEELVSLAKSMAEKLLVPYIACLQVMLPRALKPSSAKKVGIAHRKAVRVIREGAAKTPKQNEVLENLKKDGPHFIKDYSRSIISALCEQGLCEEYEAEVQRTPATISLPKPAKKITLTSQQQAVVDGILAKKERTSLIFGVTGSGKTEVYIALSRRILEQGRNVIMLVPEISLTPMMVAIFKQRFGDAVAILHSRLSDGERYDEYRRIVAGDVRIVVGARSAVFAPLENIGMIIMDEEHDTSYKQESVPRYTTIDVAKARARYHHARLVLGSATPSVESYARAKRGIYDLYEMPDRINQKPLPEVQIIDMSEEARQGHYGLMSSYLSAHLQETIDRGDQAMILINKRGYASFVKCDDCSKIISCPHCDVTLTYHKSTGELRCHYCGFHMPLPETCPNCGSVGLKKIGYGTQRAEEEIQRTIRNAQVIRYDMDTTSTKNGHTKLLQAFFRGEGNILLGTQMIAKGLDFENVTFVGVLSADMTLTLPEYRASERTFQLLTQVAGRSGRGRKSGEVVIQTYNPHHYAIADAASHNYQDFYKKEIDYRHDALYPPFCHLVSVLITGKNRQLVHDVALAIKDQLSKEVPSVKAYGPSESGIYRLEDQYRERILVKYFKGQTLLDALKSMLDYYTDTLKGKVRVICDFNPYTQI